MNSRRSQRLYRAADGVLVRAAHHAVLPLRAWPDVTDDAPGQVARQQEWLREVWSLDEISEAIEHASPSLARQVEAMCATRSPDARELRRTLRSVTRYVLRMTGRATPYGLFAGVAPASFGPRPQVSLGDGHRAVARANGAWLSDVITRLESCPELVERLQVMANTTAFVRGGRLVVPYPPRSRRRGLNPAAEVSLRYAGPVRLAVEVAQAPCGFSDLAEKVKAEYPSAPARQVHGLLTSLLRCGALLSCLHAPSGVFDALDHLVKQTEAAGGYDVPSVAELLQELGAIRDGMARHNQASISASTRRVRTALRERMTAESNVVDQPVAVDLRVGCSLTLPPAVAREAEKAATALARLTAFPFGTAGWKDFHNRFFERYGIGSFVPLREVIDPDIGLGLPTGYVDTAPEPREALTAREQRLLSLAQEAVLDGRDEIELDEELINDLAVVDRAAMQVPPNLELAFQIQAASMEDLANGGFTLAAVTPSRGIGTMTGRFLGLLKSADRERTAAVLRELPASTPGALPVQVSYPPLCREDAHVARAPELLPEVISLAEHRPPDGNTITLDDLAVGCDRRRLYLVSLSRGRMVEPMALHALDLRTRTPPLARFLIELSRSQSAVLTPFRWGAAMNLPFLPRVRYGRTVLSPARWRLRRSETPDRRAPWDQWCKALDTWRARRRVPETVALAEGDRALPIDLSESSHLALLRSHLEHNEAAVLTESCSADGWFAGRAHEVIVPMTAVRAPQGPKAPAVTSDHVLTREHGYLPGAAPWLLVKLYGHIERQPEILARHLPDLLSRWEEPPTWWFMRCRDPRWHLRLRIAVPTPAGFAPAASRITDWAAGLRRAGLVGDVQFATSYPETGRWGAGQLMRLAEEVFAADSRALAVQFAQSDRPLPQVLAAANFVSLAAAFTGRTHDGMDWLIAHARVTDPTPLGRTVLDETVHLADPTEGWASLRMVPGGAAIADAWTDRDRALARYRTQLDEAGHPDPQLVLDSLLHAHHIRAVGIGKDDERTCLRLARAAALSWKARRG